MKPKLKPIDTVDGQWTMDEAPSASALSAILTYESEEEQEELPAYDTTPRRQRPLSRVDLRSKLEEEPVFPDRTSQSRSSRTNPENPLHTAYCKYIGTNPDTQGPGNGARYYTENQNQRGNKHPLKHQKPLSEIDLRRKLTGGPAVSDPRPRSPGPRKTAPICSTEKPLSDIDLRRKLTVGPDVSDPRPRSTGPRKMAPNCSTEYRHHSFNTSGEHSRQNTSKPKNWWDPPEEEEAEKQSEDDISTDKCEGNESTDDGGM